MTFRTAAALLTISTALSAGAVPFRHRGGPRSCQPKRSPPAHQRADAFGDPIAIGDPAATPGDNFGWSIATVGNNVTVGAPQTGFPIDANGQSAAPLNSGAAYLIDGRNGNVLLTFTEPAVNGIEPSPGDEFGWAVGALGNDVLVGAPHANGGLGAVFLFDGETGKLERTFTPPGASCPSEFFGAPALATDGVRVYIGASEWGAPDASCQPTVQFEGITWAFDARTGELVSTFNDPLAETGDFFGWGATPVGDEVVILAPEFIGGAGAAYVFEAKSAKLEASIEDPDGLQGDGFGDAPAVVAGGLLAIPAQTAMVTTPDGPVPAGAVHVFDGHGNLWRTIRDPNPMANDYFGNQLAPYLGTQFLVAAPSPGATEGYDPTQPGHAYLYDAASGQLVQTFEAPDPEVDDNFGSVVAVAGANVVAASPMTNGGAGSLWIFPARDPGCGH